MKRQASHAASHSLARSPRPPRGDAVSGPSIGTTNGSFRNDASTLSGRVVSPVRWVVPVTPGYPVLPRQLAEVPELTSWQQTEAAARLTRRLRPPASTP